MKTLTLALTLFAVGAVAQTVDVAPPAPSLLERFVSPEGVGVGVGLIASALGGLAWLTQRRKKLVALASYYAFHIIEDVGNELEGEDGFDKTARYLKVVDDYMVKNGWRPLKPGEVEVAKLQASALHGAEVAKAKVVESAIAAALPAVPPSA